MTLNHIQGKQGFDFSFKEAPSALTTYQTEYVFLWRIVAIMIIRKHLLGTKARPGFFCGLNHFVLYLSIVFHCFFIFSSFFCFLFFSDSLSKTEILILGDARKSCHDIISSLIKRRNMNKNRSKILRKLWNFALLGARSQASGCGLIVWVLK